MSAAVEPGAAGKPPLLEVEGLIKHFPVRKGILGRTAAWVRAVDGISFHIREGETLGLVGESGCGKSTVGRAILGLLAPTAGTIKIKGVRIDQLSRRAMRPYRRELQVVFQDPYSSLNPRLSVGAIVAEPLVNYAVAKGAPLKARVAELFAKVGLPADAALHYPHEFSGGSASASASRAPSPSIRASSYATNRSPPSTSRCRRR